MMLSKGLAASPALETGQRKGGENQKETDKPAEDTVQDRMLHMIDMQNAFTDSFRDDDETNPQRAEQQGLTMPRGGSLMFNYAQGEQQQRQQSLMDQQDPTVGKGEIIFPNSYQQQQPMGDGRAATITTLEQHIAHQDQQHLEGHQHMYYGAAPDNLIERSYFDPKQGRTAACCCLWQPLVDFVSSLLGAENLHRSFCYGAIDGMLTGAGLVATLGGFGFFSTKSDVPLWLVAVTWVACTADALCMALGHVWSTHVLSSHAANERRDERVAFSINRNESKTKLVDLLISRGMLKIDAMSIADTLEGYPDIFVGALVGDAVVLHDAAASPTDAPPAAAGHNNLNMRGFSEGYRSYGQFNELDHDPDTAAVAVAVSESRTEGVVMMIAFSLFGSLPSIIYYCTSCLLTVPSMSSGGASKTSGDDDGDDDPQNLSARSAAMTLTCIVMWCLGVWKSKFLDSNWALFGIETVVVLMVCVMSAYALSCGLSQVVDIPAAFITQQGAGGAQL